MNEIQSRSSQVLSQKVVLEKYCPTPKYRFQPGYNGHYGTFRAYLSGDKLISISSFPRIIGFHRPGQEGIISSYQSYEAKLSASAPDGKGGVYIGTDSKIYRVEEDQVQIYGHNPEDGPIQEIYALDGEKIVAADSKKIYLMDKGAVVDVMARPEDSHIVTQGDTLVISTQKAVAVYQCRSLFRRHISVRPGFEYQSYKTTLDRRSDSMAVLGWDAMFIYQLSTGSFKERYYYGGHKCVFHSDGRYLCLLRHGSKSPRCIDRDGGYSIGIPWNNPAAQTVRCFWEGQRLCLIKKDQLYRYDPECCSIGREEALDFETFRCFPLKNGWWAEGFNRIAFYQNRGESFTVDSKPICFKSRVDYNNIDINASAIFVPAQKPTEETHIMANRFADLTAVSVGILEQAPGMLRCSGDGHLRLSSVMGSMGYQYWSDNRHTKTNNSIVSLGEISGDHRYVLAAENDGFYVYDLVTYERRKIEGAYSDEACIHRANSLAYTDGLIVFGTTQGELILIRKDEYEVIACINLAEYLSNEILLDSYRFQAYDITALFIDRDCVYCAVSTGWVCRLKLTPDLKSVHIDACFQANQSWIRSLYSSGNTLVCGSVDGVVSVWESERLAARFSGCHLSDYSRKGSCFTVTDTILKVLGDGAVSFIRLEPSSPKLLGQYWFQRHADHAPLVTTQDGYYAMLEDGAVDVFAIDDQDNARRLYGDERDMVLAARRLDLSTMRFKMGMSDQPPTHLKLLSGMDRRSKPTRLLFE